MNNQRGRRGGRKNERQKKESHDISPTHRAMEAGKYSEGGYTHTEYYDDSKRRVIEVRIKDRSLTTKEHLRPIGVTLLHRGNPFKFQGGSLKRQTAHSLTFPDKQFTEERKRKHNATGEKPRLVPHRK